MPSRSQSSSRRSSSRRSSSRNKGKASIKKTAAQDGASFWMMLTGFVCGLTVILLVISLFTKSAINTDMLSANDDNRADVATRVERQDFESFVENANVETLVKTLKSLSEAQALAPRKNPLTNVQRQLIIVDNLMEKPLSDDDRRLAIMAKLSGTAILYWTDQFKVVGEADLGIRLRDVAEKHRDDTDAEIAFEARIQLAKLNAQEATENTAGFAKEIHQLLADFPSNQRVQRTITRSLNTLVMTPEKRPATIKVLGHFFKLPKVSGSQDTENLYALLRDLESLCELNFFESRDNVQFTGEAGRDQLREVCLDLAEIPTAGNEVIGNLHKSAKWMETNGHYQHAIDIYMSLKATAERLPNPDDVAKFRQLGDWGIKRCEAVGKPFNLGGSMYDGIPLKPAAFESMPVLIVFWSKSDNTESILAKIDSASQRWRKDSVKIIAVQVEDYDAKFNQQQTRETAEQFPRSSFCYDDGSGTGPIFSQIPARSNGRIALLDRQHNLYDVDVALEELVTSVNGVLATRSSN